MLFFVNYLLINIIYDNITKGGLMKAVEYFLSGNSCSESTILGAVDNGWCDESLLPVATSFSGGCSSGCMCGAVAGSLMVIGHLFGKNNKYDNPVIARELTKEFMDKFKEIHKATCCRVLSRGTDAGTPERKRHCSSFVEFCSMTLEEMIKNAGVKNG